MPFESLIETKNSTSYDLGFPGSLFCCSNTPLGCLLLSQTQTSDKQKTHPNPFSQRIGFEYELYGGALSTAVEPKTSSTIIAKVEGKRESKNRPVATNFQFLKILAPLGQLLVGACLPQTLLLTIWKSHNYAPLGPRELTLIGGIEL